jgi:hypothetical protein
VDDEPLLLVCTGEHGLSVHLLHPDDVRPPYRSLCGVPAKYKPVRNYFELTGCMKCAAQARRLGYTEAVDLDGASVPLAGFRPAALP